MIALILAGGAICAMLLLFVRLFAGPTLYDRALLAHSMVVKAVLVCAACAVAWGRAEWLDVAIALMLVAVVLQAGVFKVFKARTFQAPLARAPEDF